MASEQDLDRAAKADVKNLEQKASFQALIATMLIFGLTAIATGDWHWSWGYLPVLLILYGFAYSASRSGLLKDAERKLKETAVMRGKASGKA